ANAAEWAQQKATWMRALREKVFRGWPAEGEALEIRALGGDFAHARRVDTYGFTSHQGVRLSLTIHKSYDLTLPKPKKLLLLVSDSLPFDDLDGTTIEKIYTGELAVAYFLPRGIGLTRSALSAADQIEVRRRYMLLGQTVDSMRVWDIRRAVAALRSEELFGDTPIMLVGYRDQAINALYASLFIENIENLRLFDAPASHASSPDYLNVLRFLDIPQAAAMSAEHRPVTFYGLRSAEWSWTTQTAQRLGWPRERLSW
ncbi:MAG: hypothetical protein JNL39_10500, partial [Opitutaceae bacterium]|nr:hypothetical protein [Opitutaceae bacterium]